MMTGDDSSVISRRESDERHAVTARRFCDALRAASGRGAEAIARVALKEGLTIAGVHTRVITPAMHQIGELWARNAISVADEHLATAIAHRVIAALYMTDVAAAAGTSRSDRQTCRSMNPSASSTKRLRLQKASISSATLG